MEGRTNESRETSNEDIIKLPAQYVCAYPQLEGTLMTMRWGEGD